MEAIQVAASCAAPAAFSFASASSPSRGGSQLAGMRRMSNFGGLKAESKVSSMGLSTNTEQEFARMMARCRAGGVARGGAAASTCNVASEIFAIVPIMSGLVLVGIALGFVLLRVEAAVEESEQQ